MGIPISMALIKVEALWGTPSGVISFIFLPTFVLQIIGWYLLVASILAVLDVNVFRGTSLDKRLDPDHIDQAFRSPREKAEFEREVLTPSRWSKVSELWTDRLQKFEIWMWGIGLILLFAYIKFEKSYPQYSICALFGVDCS